MVKHWQTVTRNLPIPGQISTWATVWPVGFSGLARLSLHLYDFILFGKKIFKTCVTYEVQGDVWPLALLSCHLVHYTDKLNPKKNTVLTANRLEFLWPNIMFWPEFFWLTFLDPTFLGKKYLLPYHFWFL